MGVFDNIRVPLAFKKKNKFTMTPITTCSQDWFSLRPVFSVEMPANSDIRVSHSYYARLSPMQKPILGSGRVVNRAFFVPYRTVMPGFDDFISDTDYMNTYPSVRYSHVPYCKQSKIVDALIAAGGVVTVASASVPYDFAISNGSGGYVYRKFNEKGRQLYAILTGLGYSLDFNAGRSGSNADDVEVSLMKLLAYFRIVADWYVNNEFFGRGRDIINQILYIGRMSMSPDSSQLTQTLANLFMLVYYSNVDNDYFSTASVQPVTPTGASDVLINDISNDQIDQSTGANTPAKVRAFGAPTTGGTTQFPSTPTITGNTAATPGNITQYAINALSALTSYMQRNNIVGHKTLDRFKSRFGVQLSADKLDRSYYLGSNQSPIGVDEVMSNADTEGAALGAYAGRGSAGDKNNFFKYNNDSNSFGCFIILSTVLPDIHYGQGISRDNLHINRLDFLTPEFDALGYQAIARCELWNDAKTVAQHSDAANFKAGQSFGLQPTYSEYCRIPDILAGDFRRIDSLDLRAFHLYRMFSEAGVEGSPNIKDYKTISENFVVGNPSEFNKVFNYTGTDWDHFYFVHSFHVSMVMPKKRLVDSYEFHDDNEGRPITMPYRGTKLN